MLLDTPSLLTYVEKKNYILFKFYLVYFIINVCVVNIEDKIIYNT